MSDREAKAKGQLRLQLNGLMQVFHCYGLQDYVFGIIDEIILLADQYHERLNGGDVPIMKTTTFRRPTD